MNSDTPKTIWLQFEDDLLDIETHRAWDEATWCVDKINDTDIEYVRADQLTAAQATIARLEREKESFECALLKVRMALGLGLDSNDDLLVVIAAKDAELQALKQPHQDQRPCCTEYATCLRACTPRGEWIAEQRLKGYL